MDSRALNYFCSFWVINLGHKHSCLPQMPLRGESVTFNRESFRPPPSFLNPHDACCELLWCVDSVMFRWTFSAPIPTLRNKRKGVLGWELLGGSCYGACSGPGPGVDLKPPALPRSSCSRAHCGPFNECRVNMHVFMYSPHRPKDWSSVDRLRKGVSREQRHKPDMKTGFYLGLILVVFDSRRHITMYQNKGFGGL